MEKAIMKDPFFLSQASEEAAKEDLYLALDLQDTLRAHQASDYYPIWRDALGSL